MDHQSGGYQPAEFTTTHWSVVLCAGESSAPGARHAMEQLCRTYWLPLYCFVRAQGFSPDDAQDITQGFFEQFLEKKFLNSVDRSRGRFRSFMLAAIKHYILNERKRAGRQKRGGNVTFVPLETVEAENHYHHRPASENPEETFDRQWATAIMDHALKCLEQEYRDKGKSTLFTSLMPYLSREPASGDYDTLCQALSLSYSAVAVNIHRLRKRYGQCIREEIARTVESPMEINDEVAYVCHVLLDSQEPSPLPP